MEELTKQELELIEQAKLAAGKAYAPYSGYRVGAALLCSNGTIFSGCNVENASYSLTICAERNAIFSAVAAGYTSYTSIAIYVESDEVFPPCGACRQVIREFGSQITVIYANRNSITRTNIADLLPGAFVLETESNGRS
jgi:cytidine deaminase